MKDRLCRRARRSPAKEDTTYQENVAMVRRFIHDVWNKGIWMLPTC